jgi:hypothetical protein
VRGGGAKKAEEASGLGGGGLEDGGGFEGVEDRVGVVGGGQWVSSYGVGDDLILSGWANADGWLGWFAPAKATATAMDQFSVENATRWFRLLR